MKHKDKINTYIKLLKEYNKITNIYSKRAYDKLEFHIQDCYHLANFPSSSGTTIEAYLVEADETLNPNVQTSGDNIDRVAANAVGCQGGASGGITKILGIMPINLNVTADTTGLRMKFNNTKALSLDMHDENPNELFKLDSAFFDFDLFTVGS